MLTDVKIIELQKKLNKVLKEFAEENDLHATGSHIEWCPNDFSAKLTFSPKELNPEGVDPRFKKDLLARGHLYGLGEDMIGREFMGRKGEYKFLGLRASKAVGIRSDNRVFYFDARFVANQLHGENGNG